MQQGLVIRGSMPCEVNEHDVDGVHVEPLKDKRFCCVWSFYSAHVLPHPLSPPRLSSHPLFLSPRPAYVLPTSSRSVNGAGQMKKIEPKAKRTIKGAEWDTWEVV